MGLKILSQTTIVADPERCADLIEQQKQTVACCSHLACRIANILTGNALVTGFGDIYHGQKVVSAFTLTTAEDPGGPF